MRRENFYRRDPGLALQGMSSMTIEERGVYNTVIDLLYLTWRPVEDDRRYIANHCNCAVQRLNPILNRLIETGKLLRFEEGGRAYISNRKFEDERGAVKGATETRSGRREVEEKSAGVREKSASVEEKSAGVRENPPLLDNNTTENQGVKPLDKSRVDKSRVETPSGLPPPAKPAAKGVRLPPDWQPSELDRAYAAKQGFSAPKIERMAERFRNYWTAKTGKTATKLDWPATWRNWVLNEAEDRPPQKPGGPAQVDWIG